MTISRLLGVAFACTISLTSTASVAAQPSDGRCDEVLDSTPGLYGLCVAYWATQEARPNTDEPPANAKILEKYREKKQDGDPDMPGLATDSGCPCWSVEAFDSLVTSADGYEPNDCWGQDAQFSKFHQIEDTDAPDHQPHEAWGVVINIRSEIGPYCMYIDTINPTVYVDSLTPEQADSCYNQVKTACDTYGLPLN